MDGTFEYSDKDSVRAFGDAQKRFVCSTNFLLIVEGLTKRFTFQGILARRRQRWIRLVLLELEDD